MIFHKPDYYDIFHCSADRCTDSCCRAGWLIPIDGETFDFYRSAGISVEQATYTDSDGDRVFKLRPDRSCPYLNPDGLCELYIKTGGRLCEICTKYPRFFEEYDGFYETGLSVSCPTAAALILSQTSDPYSDLCRETPDELLDFLVKARRRAIKMIYSEPDPDAAVKKLLGFGGELQELIDFGDLKLLEETGFTENCTEEVDVEAAKLFILEHTEILTERWRELLKNGVGSAGNASERQNYLAYLVYRWFLKAISTEDIYSQCRFIALLYTLAEHLCGDFSESVKIISREIEHDEENVEAILGFLTDAL